MRKTMRREPTWKRLNVKHERRAVFPVLFSAVIVVLAALAFSYYWLQQNCDSVAGQIKGLEREREEVARRVQNEEYKWSSLCTLHRVRGQLDAFGIAMDWPAKDRVVYLARPGAGTTSPAAPARIAQAGPVRMRHE